MELRQLVEEFLALNERQRRGNATERETARWRELRAQLDAWQGKQRNEAQAALRDPAGKPKK